MSNYQEVRCPYCLVKRKITVKPETKVKCIKCSRRFPVKAALSVGSDALSNIPLKSNPPGAFFLSLFLVVIAISNWFVYRYTDSLDGSSFITGYVVLALICVLLSRLDINGIRVLLFIFLESIGGVRVIVGLTNGMSDFVFLIVTMMFAGALILSKSIGQI